MRDHALFFSEYISHHLEQLHYIFMTVTIVKISQIKLFPSTYFKTLICQGHLTYGFNVITVFIGLISVRRIILS